MLVLELVSLFEPWMPLDLVEGGPLVWIFLKNLVNEVFGLIRQVVWEVELYASDLIVCLSVVLVLERR